MPSVRRNSRPGAGDEQLVELGQRGPVSLGVDEGAGTRCPRMLVAPDLGRSVRPAPASSASSQVEVEAPRQRIGAAPAAVGVGERGPRLAELAGDGLGEDDREAPGDEQREGAAGAQRLRDGAECGGGVVDELEGAVAADEVEPRALRARWRGSRRRPGPR